MIFLKITVFFLLFVLLLAAIALWLAYAKIKNLEKLNKALWQDRGKMARRIKELERLQPPIIEEIICPDCLGKGYVEEDIGGGNARKFKCERCLGKGEIEESS
jgi:hypothetical protein